MSVWTNWAIVVPKELYEEVMDIPGVLHDPNRGVPIFNGSLDEFSNEFHKPFIVYHEGRYIKVRLDL